MTQAGLLRAGDLQGVGRPDSASHPEGPLSIPRFTANFLLFHGGMAVISETEVTEPIKF